MLLRFTWEKQKMETITNPQKYHTHIESHSSVFHINLKELWQYKDLIGLFTKRSFVTRYKQTILGPAWLLLSPFITSVMYTLVFGQIAGLSTDGVPQILFYLGSTAIWTFFSSCLTQTAGTFTNNAAIFGKVYFPRLVVPFSITISSLLKMGIQFILFLSIYVFYICNGYSINVTWYILLLPLLVAMLAGLGLGFGLIISSMTTKYRDLRFLVSFGVQLWMYITPIIYPLSILKNNYPNYVWAIVINPLTSIIETFKIAFLGQGSFNWLYLLYSLVFTIAIMLLGMLTFNKVQRSFMDVI